MADFNIDEITCRLEQYLSAIANGTGGENLPDPICRIEAFLKVIAENGVGGSGGGSTESTSIPITAVSGSTITISPNKHYVISGVTNSLKITLSEAITTALKKYSFEFSTIDRIPTLTVNGVDLPLNLELAKHTKYLCEIVNNKLVILGAYDGYAYKFVYGFYASSDYLTSYNLKDDRTFAASINGASKSGTYAVEEESGVYLVTLTYEDSTVELFTYADGTITKDGVVYTKT